jgi:hypothetical protein
LHRGRPIRKTAVWRVVLSKASRLPAFPTPSGGLWGGQSLGTLGRSATSGGPTHGR